MKKSQFLRDFFQNFLGFLIFTCNAEHYRVPSEDNLLLCKIFWPQAGFEPALRGA
jgi:hypothetical protein